MLTRTGTGADPSPARAPTKPLPGSPGARGAPNFRRRGIAVAGVWVSARGGVADGLGGPAWAELGDHVGDQCRRSFAVH
jgi:hypothetical protein